MQILACVRTAPLRPVSHQSDRIDRAHAYYTTPSSSASSTVMDRRRALLSSIALPAFTALLNCSPALAAEDAAPATAADAITIIQDTPGFGKAAAQPGDILLVHWVGSLSDGQVFDSTRGGLKYRDGGEGALRPALLKLGGDPQPGLCQGLQQGITGMKVGGKRIIQVPAPLGFGPSPALAPYAIVPPGSTLKYEIELVRLSRTGPDAIMKGVSGCGAGAVNERTAGCAGIQPVEFL